MTPDEGPDSASSLEKLRQHREILEAIVEDDDPDAWVAELILAELDGRDPDPDVLAKRGEHHDLVIGPLSMGTPRERDRRAIRRVLQKVATRAAQRAEEPDRAEQ